MRAVENPHQDARETYLLCVSRVRNAALRAQLQAIAPDIERAALDLHDRAISSELHLFPRTQSVGPIAGTELVKTYDNRMAKKGSPGRDIYDHLKSLPEDDLCPFCDHRNVSTLDHILPKAHYPNLAVTPENLVGSCGECNKLKSDIVPIVVGDTIPHPYFDDISGHQWLFADVIESAPAAVQFRTEVVDIWGNDLNARISKQFESLNLNQLFVSQAARELSDIRKNLQRHFDSSGAPGVRSELEHQWQSRRANRLNSWQTATYEAFRNSDWFCEGGFSIGWT